MSAAAAAKDDRVERAARTLDRLTAHKRNTYDPVEDTGGTVVNLEDRDIRHGVTIGLLATIFGMDDTTIKRKLKDCPPIHRRKSGFVYDLKLASQFLVKPVFDVDKYLRNMKPSDLPPLLQAAYWDALTKRQSYEETAGQLWRTEKVMEVLGDVFQTIKFAMQLWPDTVERATALSPAQREMLVQMADGLQKEIHEKLVQMPKQKKTGSNLAELHEHHPELADSPLPETEDEDAWMDLV